MRYQGPIYRPPSEADSLLIQATIGCPHNKCTFCMVYKKGPPYQVRPVEEIEADLRTALEIYGPQRPAIFFPAGNTIAMPAAELAEVCRYARRLFSGCRRITVYGSSQYIDRKGPEDLDLLASAGLTRIHVGLESGDDEVLARTKKGADAATQVRACRAALAAGIEVSIYVLLGLGGRERTEAHARATARVLNEIRPPMVRLRTLVPKIDTLLLHQIRQGRFELLSPREVLLETKKIVAALDFPTEVVSDHYTNYLNVAGRLPHDRERLIALIEEGLGRPETDFRPFFIGTQ